MFFHWGPFSFSVFTLLVVGAIILFFVLVYLEARRKRLPEQRTIDFMILLLLVGIPAGRLVYTALYDYANFVEQPLRLFQLQDGGFNFWGALAAVLIASHIWASRNRIALESYLETVAFAFPLAISIGILGIEQSGRMMVTPYPWGIPVNSQMVHPVGAYRIALFMLMYFIIRYRWRRRAYEGESFAWFIFGFSLIELGIDFFCDRVPLIWDFSLTQVCALIAVLLVLLFVLFGKKAPARTSFSLVSFSRRERKPGFIIGMLWNLLFTGGLLALYYWLHYSA